MIGVIGKTEDGRLIIDIDTWDIEEVIAIKSQKVRPIFVEVVDISVL